MKWINDPFWQEAQEMLRHLSVRHENIVTPDEFTQLRNNCWPITQAKRLLPGQISAFVIQKDQIDLLPVWILKDEVFQGFRCVFANEVFVICSSIEEDWSGEKISWDPTLDAIRKTYLNWNEYVDRLPYLLDTQQNRILQRMLPHKRIVMELFRDLSGEPKALQREVFRYCVKLVSLEISGFCNRSCTYCPVNKLDNRKNKNRKMDFGVFQKCMNELRQIDYSGIVSFTLFNEPLYDRASLIQCLDLVRTMLPNSYIRITTNGDYLTKEYLFELIQHGIDELTISVHYDEKWDSEKQKERILKIQKRLELEEDCLLEDEKKIIFYAKRPTAVSQGKRVDIVLRTEDFEIYGNDRCGKVIDGVRKVNNLDHCDNPTEQFNVAFDGSYVPCCNCCADLPEVRNSSFGNIADYEDIFSAYASKAASNFRKALFSGRTGGSMPALCKTCSIAYMDGAEKIYRLDDDARSEIRDCWLRNETAASSPLEG